jgi:hypothetical protein
MIRYFCFLILDQSESYAITIGVRLRELKIVKREKKEKIFHGSNRGRGTQLQLATPGMERDGQVHQGMSRGRNVTRCSVRPKTHNSNTVLHCLSHPTH